MHREGYADGADGGFGGYGQMASGYPGLGASWRGVGKRASRGGETRGRRGDPEPRATRADRRSGTGRTISPCGRGRSPAGGRGGEGFGGGRVRVGLAERGGAKPPRNEQRTTDAFEGAVARSRRGARASHRHVRELSRGDDEFRRDGGVRRRHRGVRTVAHTDPERCPRHRLSSHRLPPPRAPGRTSSRVARESLERPARRRVD